MTRTWRYCALTLLAGATLLACSTTQDQSTPTSAPASASATDAAAADALVIEVRIADGSVTPVNARLDATVGRPIELVVDSDTEEELHVHATPEHTFAVLPGTGQRFAFTVEVPGRVEIELHGSHRTVATVDVRP
ncbi:hypothetical protein [Nocardia cyriacigeorgica]|uniref:EfeO-type cupredoxin-like domain-containing protein n=1 Tax=Nocardia cyriacigeorgica TaxID=135487 RepID=A0A4U8VUM5_9NOCA|nr:hypothetical protein [Nocardia cyriacigeorgica]MBF6160476.1 hypothetical protein [Nocardia cyriacigeorgica]MBF6199757.1 hypothetical protein [Nocardia cyriacigeorgica]MBF6319944.1 hypothetical protein [Nocardia cyriacigeorgica]MBF6517198.1 hypothetical protein [Nocardia cyriacigeorgica]MBF6534362.1 hypothetical protein [Nocardia cyriacigeorgica]